MKSKKTSSKTAEQMFDVIIIGGGAAGMSAALWCNELGLNALLLEAKNELGGQLLWVYNPIKNHLGSETENGRQMRNVFVKQIEKRRFSVEFESVVTDIDVKTKKVFLANGKSFSAKSLIIATGVRRRKLNVEGEDKFKNRGIIESGKREQKSVAGKRVCIVGGGDAALENCLILAETAAKIFLIHRRPNFRARTEFIEQVRANEKIEIITDAVVSRIFGDEKVEGIEIKDLKTGKPSKLSADAVLLRIGVEPNTEVFCGKLKLDAGGYIEVDNNCRTNVENVFAVGDVANPHAPTVSSAVGMGATAAKVIYNCLKQ